MIRDTELKNAIIKIGIPVALQNLLTSLLNMIDTVMIGSLGDTAVAAVGLANQWFFIYNLVVFGIVSGSVIYIAQFFGKRDFDSLQLPVACSLFLCFAVSAIFAFFAIAFPQFVMGLFTNNAETISCGVPYLRIVGITYILLAISFPIASAMRSTEVAVLPLIITGAALCINTLFNYVLINGHFGAPALGVSGAAIATTTARLFETIVMLIIMMKGITPIRLRRRHFRPGKAFLVPYIKTILPVVGNESMWGLGISMYNVIFGRMSNSIVAANQISRNLEQITTALCIGVASAGAVIIGKKIGEKNKPAAYKYAKKFAGISFGAGLVLGILMLIFTPLYLSFYKEVSADAKTYASQLIAVFGIFMSIKMFNHMCIVGILRSGGDTKFCFWLDAGSVWIVGVLSVFLSALVFRAPFWVVALCLVSEEVVKAAGGFYRFLTKKWLNDLVN